MTASPLNKMAFYPRQRKRKEHGVALVITLSMLLITTIIIVAFFSRASYDFKATSSYSSNVQSDLLASGAMDQIVGNFMNEMVQNSTVSVAKGEYWLEPKDSGTHTFRSMVPEVAVASSLISPAPHRNNLIKQSKSGVPFYSGTSSGPDIASEVSSGDTKTNRFITPTRWDLPHLLLNADESGSQTFSNNSVPDWVYVQGNGQATKSVPAATAPEDKIIGRYAYNVYDVGGLVNLNMAGNNGAQPIAIALKGSTALADLTQIPGLTAGAITEILKWRAPDVSWATTGSDTNTNISLSNLSLMDYIKVGNAIGWLRNPADTGKGNQFLSRRDLIKFATKNNFADALPFLTHFSVDDDAPSFSPDTDILKLYMVAPPKLIIQESGSQASGHNQALQISDQPRINPSRSDGKAYMSAYPLPNHKTAAAPVLFKRFPLNRLALVATDPDERTAAKSTDALTKKYFGLILDTTDPDGLTWKYSDAEEGTTYIKTLDEVAQNNREPNFFEILKSVIQVGSLGQSKQPITSVDQSLEPNANRIDEQILRIGAAMIDQADADSYPTCIRFNYEPSDPLRFGEIYGVENIPYIYGLRIVAYTKSSAGTQRAQHWFLGQLSLWNPHDPDRRPSTSDAQTKIPQSFNITAYSSSGISPILETHDPNNPVPPNTSCVVSGAAFSGNVNLKFTWKPDFTAFRQPQGILSLGYPAEISLAPTGPATYPVDSSEQGTIFGTVPVFTGPGGLTAVGFLMGQSADPKNVPKAATEIWETNTYEGGAIQFLLQYAKSGSATMHTYDRLWYDPAGIISTFVGNVPFTANTLPAGYQGRNYADNPQPHVTLARGDVAYYKTDPRSQRFIWASPTARFTGPYPQAARWAFPEGGAHGIYGGVSSQMGFDSLKDSNALWTFSPGLSSNFKGIGTLSMNVTNFSVGSQKVYYSDFDGVTRRAMAGLINGAPTATVPDTANSGAVTKLDMQVAPVIGAPLQTNAIMGTGFPKYPNKDANQAYYPGRPIVLNRPFQSIAELANTFRDVPWKNIDFSFQESGDSGLLDVFCIDENEGQPDSATPLVAGKVNLNTAPTPVLKALLQGTALELPFTSTTPVNLTDSQLTAIAKRMLEYRNVDGTPSESASGSNGPLKSLAELVGRAYAPTGGAYSSHASFVGLHTEQSSIAGGDAKSQVIQERLSAVTRALADVGTTRSWNMMIDLIAQSGSAQKSSLDQFTATSESRWWMFISIDRFTGKVLARSIERVTE